MTPRRPQHISGPTRTWSQSDPQSSPGIMPEWYWIIEVIISHRKIMPQDSRAVPKPSENHVTNITQSLYTLARGFHMNLTMRMTRMKHGHDRCHGHESWFMIKIMVKNGCAWAAWVTLLHVCRTRIAHPPRVAYKSLEVGTLYDVTQACVRT